MRISVPGKRFWSASSTTSSRSCAWAHGPVARHPDVELDEVVRPAGPRPQVVQPVELGMLGRRGEEGGALLLGPFAVHQLVDGMARGAPRPEQQPRRDDQPEDRVGPDQPDELVERQRHDHRGVEQQVGLVMNAVGGDRDRPGPRDHVPLVEDQQERRGHGDERHPDAQLGRGRRGARHQPFDRAIADPARRQRDQHDLDQGDERLGLAVAEAMVVIGGKRRDPHPGKRHHAGDQVERGVGKAAEHRHRGGRPRRPCLEPEQQHGDEHAGQRGARGERRARGLLRAIFAHG